MKNERCGSIANKLVICTGIKMEKEQILQRLNQIDDLEEKKLLREILNQVISETIDYQEQLIETVKKELKEEIQGENRRHAIYTTVLPRKQYIPKDSWLFPVLPEETKEQKIDFHFLKKCILSRQKIRIEKIFLSCDYLQINQAVKKDRFFRGILTTEKQQLEIVVKLERNKKYQKELEKMYQVFLMNQIPWETVNCAYFEKYMDVILIKCNGKLKEGEEIQDIVIDYEEYETYVEKDMIPLWNWVPVMLKGSSFPVPMEDHVNYKHQIRIPSGKQNNYFLSTENQCTVYPIRKEEGLEVISYQSNMKEWMAYEITLPEETLYDISYPLITNQVTEHFSTGYQNKFGRNIRTHAEIERKILSYITSQYVKWEGFQIKEQEAVKEQEIETYNMNQFQEENLHQPEKGKYLCLEFSQKGSWGFLQRDIISFLVTVLQEYFYEYKVIGHLLDT